MEGAIRKYDKEWYIGNLKEAGQVIIDRAEEFVGDISMCSGITVHINMDPCEIPNIDVNRTIIVIPQDMEQTKSE